MGTPPGASPRSGRLLIAAVPAVRCGVLLLGLLVWVAVEILAFVEVARQIGVLTALLLLIVVSALGPAIVRRVGFGVMAHTRERLARGEQPTREVLDGLVVLGGGALICVPGFVGDAVGLALMLGPVRHLAIRVAGHRMAGRVRQASGRRWTVVDARTHAPPSDRPGGPTQLPPG